MSAFGPSAQVLGLSTDGTSPKSSSELYYIGPSYVSNSGQQRIAGPGQVFLQDPVTKTILLRSVADGAIALQRPEAPVVTIATHPATVITDLFQQAYGRPPTNEEINYWRMRTDKSGAALLGAMEYAYSISDSTNNNSGLTEPAVEFTIDPNTVLNLKPSGDSLADALLATYGDAIQIEESMQELSEDTLIIVFYGSNQDMETTGSGIRGMVASLRRKATHVLPLETGKNLFYDEETNEQLNDYNVQYELNRIDVLGYLSNNPSVTSVIFFGYSWGAKMAYDITVSTLTAKPDLRVLGTIYLDGINASSLFTLGFVHPASESVLNIYQSRGGELLHGTDIVPVYETDERWYPRTQYEDFDHFYNALGSILQMDVDDYLNQESHGSIDGNGVVMLTIEKFILGIIEDAFSN